MKAAELFSVKDKVVLMTGTSGLLGSTMRTTLEENGARVIAVRYEEIDQLSNKVKGYVVNVLVNCGHPMNGGAGFSTEGLGSTEVQANLDAAIHTSLAMFRLVLPRMHQGGSIINVSSMYALIAPNPRLYEGTEYMNPIGYGIAKAGMIAMTRYIASFYGRAGIRCNALVPGAFPKPDIDSEFQQRLADRTALDRVGKPSDLSGALLFLASDASSYMTGQCLIVDGGWSIT